MTRLRWLPAALLAACSSAPSAPGDLVPPDVPVVRALPAGTVLRLPPCQGAASLPATPECVDGLWREALRQSVHLDFAAGPCAAGPDGLQLLLTLDGTHGSAAATLQDQEALLHVAAIAIAGRALPAVLDDLAWRVRLALGDPVESAPLPVASIYSADPDVVHGCECALVDVRLGNFAVAARRLAAVRRQDGGSAFLLETMAGVASMQGDAEGSRRLAEEALALRHRLSPTTTHRLLRTLLLSRASTSPELAAQFDDELMRLSQVGARERPHDPEVRLTAGIAQNFLGQFEAARATLVPLAARMPDHVGVLYHLGWSELGGGNGAAAVVAFDRAAVTLPTRTTVVPRALARYTAGDHDGLRAFLTALADDPLVRAGAAMHEVRRMQAAHELLCGRPEAAAEVMLQDLAWLLAHPMLLEVRAGELAEAAETLVRLGYGERLRPHLASIHSMWPDSLVGDAASFADGLVEAAAKNSRAELVEAGLQRRGRGFWASALAAYGHRQQGELAAEQDALGRAAQQSTSPLVKAALIDNLRAQGRSTEAATLRAALHRELLVVDLRRKSQHPLLGPELALAWLQP